MVFVDAGQIPSILLRLVERGVRVGNDFIEHEVPSASGSTPGTPLLDVLQHRPSGANWHPVHVTSCRGDV